MDKRLRFLAKPSIDLEGGFVRLAVSDGRVQGIDTGEAALDHLACLTEAVVQKRRFCGNVPHLQRQRATLDRACHTKALGNRRIRSTKIAGTEFAPRHVTQNWKLQHGTVLLARLF